ncbi:MAG: hypothetical protein IJ400_01510 [Clostridia bacterium]|nr:hypothetical protein [Clostridia bacterium]
MSELKLCGVIFCALSLIVVFKSFKAEYSLFIRIAMTIGVTIATLLIIQPVLSYVESLTSNLTINKYIPYLLKALGIAFIVQITADCCNDVGEGTLAERVCLFGKIQIVVISLPLIDALLSLTKDVIK